MTDVFQAFLLGPFRLCREGVPLDTRRWQRPETNVLKVLLTSPGRRRLRDDLIELFWPDATPQAGYSNLRYALHLLRRDLGGDKPSAVLSEGGWIALNSLYLWEVDLDRLERMAQRHDVEALEEATSLLQGEPLPENRYDDWAVPVRDHIRRQWREACLRLVERYRSCGRFDAAVSCLQRLLESDPLDEEPTQILLSTLTEMGRRTEALRHYRDFAARLWQELEVEPQPETSAIAARLRPQIGELPAPERRPVHIPRAPAAVTPTYPLLRPGPLAGREREFALLSAAVPGGSDTSATPLLTLLAGEAGMGKTRLLAELAFAARGRDVLTLAGGSYEQEGRLPYGPIRDALADYIKAQPDEVLREMFSDLAPELGRILPEMHAIFGIRPNVSDHGAESERVRLFATVVEALRRISRDQPLLLLLDDLHWSDDATLQLLHFLLRQPPADRVAIVGAYRAEEVSEGSPIEHLAGANVGSVQVIRLGGLSEPQMARALEQWAGGRCASALEHDLYERSGGNPFFALQMLRLLKDERGIEQGPEGWSLAEGVTVRLPAAVRETVSRRLRGLDADEREALMLGAVLGREFKYASLAAIWEADERSLFAALDVAALAHIISETDEGYTFRHPVLREVVYHRLPSARRAMLHERAALKLEDLYGHQAEAHAAELAHHFVSAGRVYIDRALHYLMTAGDQAEEGYAHAEAEEYYRQAIDLARQLEDPSVLAAALEKLGRVLKAADRLHEALGSLEEAAQTYKSAGDLEGEGRVVALMGLTYYFTESSEEGIARLEPVVERLEKMGPSTSLALLYASLPRLYLPVARYKDGLAAAERAVDLARQLQDEHLLADAVFVRGRSLLQCTRVEEAISVLDEAIRLAQALPDLFVLTAAYYFAGTAYLARGELGRSQELYERGLRTSEERSGLEQMSGMLWQTSHISFLVGDWEAARRHAERHLSLVRSVGGKIEIQSNRIRGTLALHSGDWEQASTLLRQYAALAEQPFFLPHLPRACSLLAELDLLQGRPGQALARLVPQLGRPLWQERVDILIPLAWAHLDAGNLAEAAETVQMAITAAGVTRPITPTMDVGVHEAYLLVDALRIKGMVLAREGRGHEAERVFQEAVLSARRMPYPYAEARALYEWGRMLVEEGEREKARSRLEDALAIFERLGAHPYIQRTEQVLDGLRLRS